MLKDNRDRTPNPMNNATATRAARTGSTIQRITIPRFIALTLLTLALLTFITPSLHAQPATPAPDAFASVSDPSTLNPQPLAAPKSDEGGSTPSITAAFQPVIDGLAGHYGFLTTVLLVVGSLRILFKPIMLVLENALKNDPAKFAELQRFEAGPLYKTIATVLDFGASIKLPLVKPPGPPNP